MNDADTLPPSLRQRQKDTAREAVMEAVGECLSDVGLEQISFAEVAARAGMSERTVYRHFPSRELLLDAFWEWLHAQLKIVFPTTAQELIDLPLSVFPMFEAREPIIRGMLASAQGRRVRLSVNDERQAAIRAAVRDAVGKAMAEPAFTRLCAQVQLLYSATGWLTMRDYWDLSGEEAGLAASEAIAKLLNAAREGL